MVIKGMAVAKSISSCASTVCRLLSGIAKLSGYRVVHGAWQRSSLLFPLGFGWRIWGGKWVFGGERPAGQFQGPGASPAGTWIQAVSPSGKIDFKGLKLRRSKDEIFSPWKNTKLCSSIVPNAARTPAWRQLCSWKAGGRENLQAKSVVVQRYTPEQRLAQCHEQSSKPLKKKGSLGFMCNFISLDIFLLIFQGLLFKTCGFIALGRVIF